MKIDDAESRTVAANDGVMAGDGGGIEKDIGDRIAAKRGLLGERDGKDLPAMKEDAGGGAGGGGGGFGAALQFLGSGEGAGIEEDGDAAEGEEIAGLEKGAVLDGYRADTGAPLALEIRDPALRAVVFQLAMAAGDLAMIETEIGFRGATEDKAA